MSYLHIIIIALIQGIAEFLPISSSGHLVLIPLLTNWTDQGLLFDVAVHLGTLGAVIAYFYKDIIGLFKELGALLTLKHFSYYPLLSLLGVGTLPAVGIGYIVKSHEYDLTRSIKIIGWSSIIFGILLFLTDRYGNQIRRLEKMTYCHALFIGFAQALALIPGVSRSGVTISAARFLGFQRVDAVHFSFLLSVPCIFAAFVLTMFDAYKQGEVHLFTPSLLWTMALSFIFGVASITFLMRWIKKAGFTPFVIYRLVLGISLISWAYWPSIVDIVRRIS